GVLFRDLRYWGSNLPVRTLTYPTSSAKRDFGVTSICLDRYRSSLFVSTTDSFIWEYAINSTKNSPIDVLRGVKRSSVCAFDMKLSASPISDHLTYGSGESQALLWDLQERNYSSRILNASRNEYYPYPKFTLGGHTTEVSIAQFSCSAQYIVSMDDTTWRLWQLDTSFVEKIASKPIGFEQIEFYSFPFSQRTSSQLERLSVTSGNSPSTKRKTPLTSPFESPFKSNSTAYPMNVHRSPAKKSSNERLSVTSGNSPSTKRKTPLTSPFESPFKSNSTAYPMNVHRSPAKKSSKLSSSPFSPLPNICNVEIVKHSRQLRSARRLDFSPEKVFSFENTDFDSGNAELPKCAFHFKYPTQNLPDWVKERHRAKAEQQLQQQSPSTSSQKMFANIRDYFNPPSPRYPTQNLPDWVKERHRAKAEQQLQQQSPSTSSQKMFANIRDYFNPPSPSVSNCSRMLSQAERELQRSPRKLLLKQRLRESAERAQKVAKLATPRRSRAAARRVPLSRCSNVKTPISITNGTTQKMTDSSSSVTPTPISITNGTTQKMTDSSSGVTPVLRRTLEDFFRKKSQ
uniref:WD_REPEATS_REGION domain-containing protein n=1 Tax=Ascaris lumbricoides TaxID=6252 RepID=A0A0M3ILS8_ASCLU